jgi:anti-anti-sigma regulatory factor
MLRIERSENEEVVFTLSGQIDSDTMAELERLIDSEAKGRGIVLNLKDLTLVDEGGVIFLTRCESNGVKLENCPPYVREWINRQRLGS